MDIYYTNQTIKLTIENVDFTVQRILSGNCNPLVPSHSHSARCYEIHYITAGLGRALINGNYYDLTPNTLFITGPHVEHQVMCAPDSLYEYCIYLEVPKNAMNASVESVPAVFFRFPFWFGQDTQDIHRLMLQLSHELEHRFIGYKENIRALLYQLIISVVRNYQQTQDFSSISEHLIPRDSLFILVEDYFMCEYRNLNLENLAKKLGLSSRQTERYLKNYYGKTFLQKKTESRMSMAAVLLADSAYSITMVSEELNYSSVEHFSNAFRHYYGCGPREYRKRILLLS